MKRPFPPKRRGASAPLTNPQKAYLSQLAEEAHSFLEGKGAIDEKLTVWRREEAIRACGRRISEAMNGDFETLEAHFHALAGKTDKALKSAIKADTNDERQARFKLDQLCKQRGIPTPALEGATVKRIWAVYFNIKQQPKRQAAKASAAPGSAVNLQAELAKAVKEERYEDAAQLKKAIAAQERERIEDLATHDEIPF